ncbi:MAG: protein kinase [Chloroflexota bacterium]|nr:protein kinase [Chloroflexota bacterium]
MADRVGQQLGNYRLVRLLGQGGFAEVYLGEHIYLDTEAAIKVLHTRVAEEDEGHFRREARTIAGLVHPHIVRVLEFGVEGTTPFLVVDYAPNGTLRKRHPRGVPLPLADVLNYVVQVAAALQYAHDRKVVHRDVKPENMLLGRHNEVLLSDFGIALVAQSSRHYSTQGPQDMAGTVAYMAPEQIQAHAIPASDQYSLAIVAYEWLAGERPFQGSFTEIAIKHTLAVPASLREKTPALPAAVEEAIMTALHKDPAQRFPTVWAFATALAQAGQGAPRTTSLLENLPAAPEQQSLAIQTLLLSNPDASATILSTLAGTTQPPPNTAALEHDPAPADSMETPLEHDPAPADSMETPNFEGTPTLVLPLTPAEAAPPVEAVPESPSEPPVQSSLAPGPGSRISRRTAVLLLAGVAVVGAAGGGIALLARSHGQPAPRVPMLQPGGGALKTPGTLIYTYTGHNDWVWRAAWSPDGQRIASASADRTAQVWDATTGDHLTIYSGHSAPVYAVSWSPDGRHIASASNDKTVLVFYDTLCYEIYTYSGHSDWVWTVAWSPDKRRIASAGRDATVQVWNAADGHHLYTYRGHSASVYSIAWSPDGTRIASGSGDGTVQVWNAHNGGLTYTYQPYFTTMWGVAWSADGTRIASASDNKTVQLWDAAGGGHLYVYYGHADFVYSVAWSPDGTRIASASDDKTVQLWNAGDGSPIYTYTGHADSVRSAAWSPDGTYIASGSWDKTVQVWQAE